MVRMLLTVVMVVDGMVVYDANGYLSTRRYRGLSLADVGNFVYTAHQRTVARRRRWFDLRSRGRRVDASEWGNWRCRILMIRAACVLLLRRLLHVSVLVYVRLCRRQGLLLMMLLLLPSIPVCVRGVQQCLGVLHDAAAVVTHHVAAVRADLVNAEDNFLQLVHVAEERCGGLPPGI